MSVLCRTSLPSKKSQNGTTLLARIYPLSALKEECKESQPCTGVGKEFHKSIVCSGELRTGTRVSRAKFVQYLE